MGVFKKGRTAWAITLIALCIIGVWWYQWMKYQTAPAGFTVTNASDWNTPDNKIKGHALVETFTIDDAVQKADIIAEVAIKEKVKELYEPNEKTIYNAQVVQMIKGDLAADAAIYIMQDGNSKVSINDNPQFQSKEQYIFILKKAVGFDNTYWILGSETGVYEVIDENTVVKWAKPEEKLEAIEVNKAQLKINKTAQVTIDKLKDKQPQFINKEQFEQLLRAELKEEASQ